MTRTHVVVSRKAFYFEVQACRAASVVLLERPGVTSSVVRIVIGDNDNAKTVIILPNGVISSADTPYILSCEQYRKFWISWENGQIRLGHGLPYDQVIVTSDYVQPVSVVALSTDVSVTGDWRFLHEEGNAAVIEKNTIVWPELPIGHICTLLIR